MHTRDGSAGRYFEEPRDDRTIAQRLQPAPVQPGLGPAAAKVELVQHLRFLDERRAQRRRLCIRCQPLRPGPRKLAGADRLARRYLHRASDRQPCGQAEPASRCALSCDLSPGIWRVWREHSCGDSRLDRGGLVRDSDVPGFKCLDHRGAALLPTDGGVRGAAFCGFVLPWLVWFPQPVAVASGGVLGRHGIHPAFYRLGRAGGLRGDVRPGGLDRVEGGLVEHQLYPGGKIAVGLAGLRPGDRGDGVGGVVLLRADPELRRLQPLLPQHAGRATR